MTFTGSGAAVNAALDGLSFMPSAGFSGAADLSISVNDQGNTGAGGPLSDSDVVAINILPNVAPTVTASGGTTAFTEGSNVLYLGRCGRRGDGKRSGQRHAGSRDNIARRWMAGGGRHTRLYQHPRYDGQHRGQLQRRDRRPEPHLGRSDGHARAMAGSPAFGGVHEYERYAERRGSHGELRSHRPGRDLRGLDAAAHRDGNERRAHARRRRRDDRFRGRRLAGNRGFLDHGERPGQRHAVCRKSVDQRRLPGRSGRARLQQRSGHDGQHHGQLQRRERAPCP